MLARYICGCVDHQYKLIHIVNSNQWQRFCAGIGVTIAGVYTIRGQIETDCLIDKESHVKLWLKNVRYGMVLELLYIHLCYPICSENLLCNSSNRRRICNDRVYVASRKSCVINHRFLSLITIMCVYGAFGLGKSMFCEEDVVWYYTFVKSMKMNEDIKWDPFHIWHVKFVIEISLILIKILNARICTPRGLLLKFIVMHYNYFTQKKTTLKA